MMVVGVVVWLAVVFVFVFLVVVVVVVVMPVVECAACGDSALCGACPTVVAVMGVFSALVRL
jgi:hypothetical protein